MSEKPASGHGGARQGAGRPSEGAVRVQLTMGANYVQWLDYWAKSQGQSRSQIVRGLIRKQIPKGEK